MWRNSTDDNSNSPQTQISLISVSIETEFLSIGTENIPRTVKYTKGCDMDNIDHYENILIAINGNRQTIMGKEIQYISETRINYCVFFRYSYFLFKN